jgi:hypothetical protein
MLVKASIRLFNLKVNLFKLLLHVLSLIGDGLCILVKKSNGLLQAGLSRYSGLSHGGVESQVVVT